MNPTIREKNAILLVHPPVAKACEPPGGPARLAGAMVLVAEGGDGEVRISLGDGEPPTRGPR